MKRPHFLFPTLTLLLGVTLGCMVTLMYVQQVDPCDDASPVLSTGSNRIVDREIKTVVVASNERIAIERRELQRLGCVCGEEAARLRRTAAGKVVEQKEARQQAEPIITSAPNTSSTSSSSAAIGRSAMPADSVVSTDKYTAHVQSQTPSSDNPHKCSSITTSSAAQGVIVAILTSSERINRSSVAFDTWGMDMGQVVIFVGNETDLTYNGMTGLPFVRLADVRDHRQEKSGPRKMFKALTYLYQHFSDQYKWFVLVSGEVYIHGRQLQEFLGHLNSDKKLYLGHSASGRAKDSKRLKLLPHEQYCMGGPGVVLSQATMKALYPHLDTCLETVEKHNLNSNEPQWYNEDVELGRCISRSIGIQCSTNIDQVKMLFYEDYARESQIPSVLWAGQVFKNVLTVHPVVSADHMRALHHYYKMLDYHDAMNQAQDVQSTINELCDQLPAELRPPHPVSCRATLSNVEVSDSVCPGSVVESMQQSFYPRNRYHIAAWKYFDPQNLLTDQMDYPSYKLRVHRRYYHELQKVLLEVVNTVNSGYSIRKMKLKRFTNGYVKYDNLYGNEYIIDGVFEEMGNSEKLIEKRVHLKRLLAVNYVQQNAKFDISETVHFIVPISNVGDRVSEFMQMYEKLSLMTHENTHLIVVVYEADELRKVQDSVVQLRQSYPFARFTTVRGKGDFTRAKALDLGISQLRGNDLAFFCDIDMQVQREFLSRCRRNAVQGKQVYYPEFFKLYNMDYAYFNSEKPKIIDIKRQNGHWAYYSYGMACIYKSDYKMVGGFDTGITGWGDEDVELYEKILRRKLEVFRAPDPGLTHLWHKKTCSESHSTAKQYKHCLSSQGENLADRIELAQYILQQQRPNRNLQPDIDSIL